MLRIWIWIQLHFQLHLQKCWCRTLPDILLSQCNKGGENTQVVEYTGKERFCWEIWVQVFLWIATNTVQVPLCADACFSVLQKIHHYLLLQLNMRRPFFNLFAFLCLFFFFLKKDYQLYCLMLKVVLIIGICLRWSWRSCTSLEVINFGTVLVPMANPCVHCCSCEVHYVCFLFPRHYVFTLKH